MFCVTSFWHCNRVLGGIDGLVGSTPTAASQQEGLSAQSLFLPGEVGVHKACACPTAGAVDGGAQALPLHQGLTQSLKSVNTVWQPGVPFEIPSLCHCLSSASLPQLKVQ